MGETIILCDDFVLACHVVWQFYNQLQPGLLKYDFADFMFNFDHPPRCNLSLFPFAVSSLFLVDAPKLLSFI